MSLSVSKVLKTHASSVLNHEWIKAYHYACPLALRPANVNSGFHRASLVPLAPGCVVRRLPQEPEPPPHPTTPTSIREKVLLKASPTGPTFKEVIAIIKGQLAFRAPLDSAAQVFLNLLMDRTKAMHAEITIARRGKEEMRVQLERRKNRNKGKRLVIKDAFIFLMQDLLDGVQQDEYMAAAYKANKRPRRGRAVAEAAAARQG